MAGPISVFFLEDHRRLDSLLHRALARDPIDREAYAQFRSGLLKHIALEEKLLLPAARRRRGGEPLPMARQLRVDHGAIALLLVPSPSRELIAEIQLILGPHNLLEEGPGGLYSTCDKLLAADSADLLAKARAYPEVKVAPHYDGDRVCRTAREALRISGTQR